MGTVSRVHTFASGAILTAAQLNNEFDNLLTSSAINGGLDATNLGVTAGQATASKALVVDASRNLADATGSNRINNLALSGTFESTGAVTASAGITSGGNIVSDTDSTDDLGTTGVRWANLFVDDVTVTNNVTIGGTLTLTGGITLNGNTTIGDSSADTLTVNSTITSNLIFTDNTYDIGASGATRPRDLFLSRNAVMGGTLGVTGLITATGGVSGALTGNVTGNVTGNLTGDVTGNISGNVTGGTISGTTGTYSGNVTISKDAPQLIMTDSGSGGGTSDIIIDAIGSNHGFYFRADGASNHVILESNGDFKVDADTLFVDASADRVGINTASPLTDVHLYSSGLTDGIRVQRSGFSYYTQLNPTGLTNSATAMEFDSVSSHLFKVGGVEKMRLDSSGNVGIGTNSPSSYFSTDLVVKASATGGGVTIVANGTTDYNNILFARGTSGNDRLRGQIQYLHSVDRMNFVTDAQTAMVIDSSQRVGIGTISPSRLLHLSSTGGTFARFTSENTDDFSVGANANGFVVYNETDADYPFVITNTGNVGIGTSSPSYKTEIAAGTNTEGLAVTASSGDVYLQTDGQLHGYQKLDVTSAGLQIKGFSDGGGAKTQTGKIYITQDAAGSAGGEFRLYLNNGTSVVERLRVLKEGGITFNGDTSTANALDDYEEGTWTPTIDGFTGTYGNQTGTYVKIGQLVHASCYVTLSSITSMDGTQLDVSGFPFAAENSTSVFYAGNFGNFGFLDLPTGTVDVAWNIGNGLTYSTCRAMKDNANYENVLNTAITSTSFFMYVSWTYRTA